MGRRIRAAAYYACRGVAGTGVWALAEPLLRRLFRTPYSDVQLFGRLLAREGDRRRATLYGVGVHLLNGAVFGAVFGFLGGRTRRQAVSAAVAENTALWPLMEWVDRTHPDRKSGAWPRLVNNPRVIAQGFAAHLIFALVLGGGRSTPRRQ